MGRHLTILGLLILTAAAYWPVRQAGFVFDDGLYVTDNPFVLDGLTATGIERAFAFNPDANWIPLTWISLMLDVELHGADPGGFHSTNLLLHGLSVLLLFLVFERMTGQTSRSALVAGLFALHPLHVESVAWISERKDVLSTCFGLVALLVWVRSVRRPDKRTRLIAWVAFIACLMAKPMLVTLPLLLLLLDYWPLARLRRDALPRLVAEKLPWIAVSLVFSAIAFAAQWRGGAVGDLDRFPLSTRLANAVVAYALYIKKALWPVDLAVFYPHPGSELPGIRVAAAALALGVASVAVAAVGRRRPYAPVGWLWYLGTLVPVIGLVQIGTQQLADRYTYVPLIGLAVVAAWTLPLEAPATPRTRLAAQTVAVATLMVCAFMTRVQVGFWNSDVTLFERAVAVTENNALAHNNLGAALRARGRPGQAVEHYRQALRIDPDRVVTRINLGDVERARGRMDRAAEHYREALRLAPGDASVHGKLGLTLKDQGRPREAEALLTRALELGGGDPQIHTNLGLALKDLGRLDEAIASFRDALRLDPEFAPAHNNWGALLLARGGTQEAIVHLEHAVRLDPDNGLAHYNLGNALMGAGRAERAIDHFRAAVRLDPRSARAHNNLAMALRIRGELEPAIQHFEQALRIDSGLALTHRNLADALAANGRTEAAREHYREASRLDPSLPVP